MSSWALAAPPIGCVLPRGIGCTQPRWTKCCVQAMDGGRTRVPQRLNRFNILKQVRTRVVLFRCLPSILRCIPMPFDSCSPYCSPTLTRPQARDYDPSGEFTTAWCSSSGHPVQLVPSFCSTFSSSPPLPSPSLLPVLLLLTFNIPRPWCAFVRTGTKADLAFRVSKGARGCRTAAGVPPVPLEGPPRCPEGRRLRHWRGLRTPARAADTGAFGRRRRRGRRW